MRILSAMFAAAIFLQACASNKGTSAGETPAPEVEKIWDKAPHNAFTDLLRFNNAFYCAFREGNGHVSGPDGKARILRSKDGKQWESVALLEVKDRDVRDPKLSITPDNRIMVLMDVEAHEGKKVISRKPLISISDASGTTFSTPEESVVDPAIASWSDWVWRLTWLEGTGYAILYQIGADKVFLVSTKDGRYFQSVSQIEVDGYANESTIRFDKDGKMYVLIRRDQGDGMAMIATATAPYKQWELSKMKHRLGGPNFLFLNDETLVMGVRKYVPKTGTVVYVTDLKGNVLKGIDVPSGGDNSYPGMLFHKGKLWMSYYSSHEGKTSIYLAKIPLKQLKSR
ncbi:sialidase family protein [Chitinophaga sp.]|uniref:sialidase family protein n=1 Tax=Chitinophaga sp. TaxID=1869181 RepID=UPI0031CF0AA7